MARKKRIAITFLSVIILLAGFFIWFFVLKKETAVVVPTIDTVADQRCYGTREFARGGVFNYNLVAIDFFNDARAEALLDYKNDTIESSGIIEGIYSRENNQINGIYDFYTNNELYSEERSIRFNEVGLVFGFGEMYKDEHGIMRYKDDTDISFDYPLPLISCQRYDIWKQEYQKVSSTTGIITTQ